MTLTLIQRDDCHLCDLAWEVLAAAGVADFESLWIDADAGLEARYGERIPVLRREDSGAELDWPFSAEAVRGFMADRD
ncbi:glutaredoxin family protein [Arenimonas alkanexedens]